ncbi:MAG TPA: hypothetical protein VG142_01775 [Trebonia sp.]|jgi:hypothetical protein|nr:hypothetical protein [Trebonia sp.]
MTNWIYPNSNDATGEIRQANTDLCMQLDESSYGDIIEAPCVDDLAEQWENIYNVGTDRTEFVSLWGLDNADAAWCLSNEGDLTTQDCSLDINNEQWGTS